MSKQTKPKTTKAAPVGNETRIGVFVCRCGKNIAATVDVPKVAQELGHTPGVVVSEEYSYMCSDPGQNLIEAAIRDNKLNGIVVACCSENLHESTFRGAAKRAGLNPYQAEIANIREKCSWVHENKEEATRKAILLTKSQVERVKEDKPLEPVAIPVTQRCLVIGAGVAGIQAALDVADMGYEVILVEKQPSIGGHMAQLSETFPTLDCSQCILTPKMVAVSKHENIRLMTQSEVVEVKGYVGNFEVTIREEPKYVDPDKCILCADCEDVCPQVTLDEFNMGLSARKAIYIPFPQAVPATYTLDENYCLGINPLRCSKCRDVCEPNAINFDRKPTLYKEQVGAIVVATGYDQYDVGKMTEYGVMQNPDVMTGLEFERLLSASGPTEGMVRRPSDGKIPKEVVFIQCSGSRDDEHHNSYCSKICCMYTAKHALLYRHTVHDGHVTIFYIDIRAGGKDYEEFVNRAMEDERILYLRGKVARMYREGDKTIVMGVDTLSGRPVKVAADMVVLAQALVPSDTAQPVVETLKLQRGPDGFMKEAHPKLRPVESLTPGVFLAGVAQGPKDIPEAVAQASGAASKAGTILSSKYMYHEPTTAIVDETKCTGCEICATLCPYQAVKKGGAGVAEVNPAKCEGCGICAGGCPTGAITVINQTDDQITTMIEVLVRS